MFTCTRPGGDDPLGQNDLDLDVWEVQIYADVEPRMLLCICLS